MADSFGSAHQNLAKITPQHKTDRLLVAALGDGHAAVAVITALGDCGKDATPALPQLRQLKFVQDDAIRKAATAAVERIE